MCGILPNGDVVAGVTASEGSERGAFDCERLARASSFSPAGRVGIARGLGPDFVWLVSRGGASLECPQPETHANAQYPSHFRTTTRFIVTSR